MKLPENVSESVRRKNPHLYGMVATEVASSYEVDMGGFPITCRQCHKVFRVAYSSQADSRKYCSLVCAYASKDRVSHIKRKDRGQKICLKCGVEFQVTTAAPRAKFCSQHCASSFIGTLTLSRNRRKIPVTKRVEHNCKNCGRAFLAWVSSERKYCSIKCASNDPMLQTKRSASWRANENKPKTYSRAARGWVQVGAKRIFARSRWEANYARFLEFQRLGGLIEDWDHEVETFWFTGIKRGCMSYLPDFKVTKKAGVEYHEVKGWMDKKSITKIKRMAKYHPSVKLIVIDQDRYKQIAKSVAGVVPGWK